MHEQHIGIAFTGIAMLVAWGCSGDAAGESPGGGGAGGDAASQGTGGGAATAGAGGRPQYDAGPDGEAGAGATAGAAGSGGNAGVAGASGAGGGSAGATFRVATYNAGLAVGYEPFVAERKPAIEKALGAASSELDVLCVQEYWEEQHFDDLEAEVVAELPFALRPAPVPGPASCTQGELDALFGCLAQSCASEAGGALIDCALASCSAQVVALAPQCLSCAHDQAVAGATSAQIYGACIPGSAGTSGETPALFGGAFDIGLLSRFPFDKTEVKRLDSALVRAAVAYGKIVQNGKNLHVFCTHLGSGIGSFPYPIPGGSWQAENQAQAAAVVDYVKQTAGTEPAIVLGDLNTGPTLGALVAEWPDSFQVLADGGFQSLFTAQDAACSLCPENTFRADDSDPTLVDHVLMRGSFAGSSGGRFMTELELLKVGTKWVATHRSDHFGVTAKVSL